MPRRQSTSARAIPIVYDAGALVAADKGDRKLWAAFAAATVDGRPVVVPAPVVTQAWRGWRTQAQLAKLLSSCRILPADESVARAAGVLLGSAGTKDAVDAIVVATAVALHAGIVTSDVGDITRLIDSADVDFAIPVIRI
jgi:predicted nucleic acid-binding protein